MEKILRNDDGVAYVNSGDALQAFELVEEVLRHRR